MCLWHWFIASKILHSNRLEAVLVRTKLIQTYSTTDAWTPVSQFTFRDDLFILFRVPSLLLPPPPFSDDIVMILTTPRLDQDLMASMILHIAHNRPSTVLYIIIPRTLHRPFSASVYHTGHCHPSTHTHHKIPFYAVYTTLIIHCTCVVYPPQHTMQ